MSFDLRRKILILALSGVLIILVYQLALFKDYSKLYKNIPSFFLRRVEISPGNGGHRHSYTDKDLPVLHFKDEAHHTHDDTSGADDLKRQVRVLCWVMTSPSNHLTRAVHVLGTWGKRCNKIIFATESDADSGKLPIFVVNTTSGRDHLTAKTMQTFDHLFKHFLLDFDWFLKADDDTYVIVENMRYFLSSQDSERPIFFGHHFVPIVSQGYFSGGAGYILSREALKRFGERKPGMCKGDEGSEDVEMGYCMQRLGVVTGDSRDALGRSRFHCFNPETHIHGGYPDWYKQYDKYGAHMGIESISDYAITFHYVSVEHMYNLEFFIYHLRPYGILSGKQDLNVRTNMVKSTPTEPMITSIQPRFSSSPQNVDNLRSRKKMKKRRRTTIAMAPQII